MTHLAAVAGSHVQEREDQEVGFCSYCGAIGGDGPRVCGECGLGVRLETAAGVLRSPGAAFLVVRGDGRVSAASSTAERIFGRDGDLSGEPLGALMVARADDGELARSVSIAAAGGPGTVGLDVELAGVTGTPRARSARVTVARCGLPPAALVVIERV